MPSYGFREFTSHVYICSTAMISYSTTPPGVVISISLSTSLPIKPRAIGEFNEIRPVLKSASSSPTIWYLTSTSVSIFNKVTVVPKITLP